MSAIFQFAMSYIYLIYYVFGISIVRGLIIPDFRYGVLSIVVIQVAYPVLLLLPLLIKKGVNPGYGRYLFLGITGIVLSEIVSISRYALGSGVDAILDSVTSALFILSFSAMTALFAVMLAFVIKLFGK